MALPSIAKWHWIISSLGFSNLLRTSRVQSPSRRRLKRVARRRLTDSSSAWLSLPKGTVVPSVPNVAGRACTHTSISQWSQSHYRRLGVVGHRKPINRVCPPERVSAPFLRGLNHPSSPNWNVSRLTRTSARFCTSRSVGISLLSVVVRLVQRSYGYCE